MINLSSLPNEILLDIAQFSGKDVRNLRAVNKTTNSALDAFVWQTFPVIINFNRKNPRSGILMLQEFIHASSDKFWRLEIKSLDPSREYNPPGRGRSFGALKGKRSKPDDMVAIEEAHEMLPGILPKALSALKGLRSIKWYVSWTDLNCATYEMVLEPLGHLLHLADVQIISNNDDTSTLPLHHLKHGSLRRLTIQQRSGRLSDPRQLISSLTTVFTQNPRLVHLELDMSTYGTSPLPFEDLFQNIPPNTLQLHSLLLSGWSIQLSQQVQPHLQSLTSLVAGNSDFAALWKWFHYDCSPDAPLPFLRISCKDISDELLDLLQLRSIPRLEILEFRHARADKNERSIHFAQRFYNDILCRYHGTLTELYLIPEYTGDWTIGLRNLGIFDGFKQLRKLAVALNPFEIVPGGEEKDIVASFITRVMRLPSLSTLSLHTVTYKPQPPSDEAPHILVMHTNLNEMHDSIEKAVIPAATGCGHFRVVIPSKLFPGEFTVEFIPEANGEGSQFLMFRQCP